MIELLLTAKNGYYQSLLTFIKRQFYVKKRFVCETKIGHYSQTLIIKAVVSVTARRCAYFIISILYSINNSKTNYIIDLINTQNVRSEALATFL